MTSVCPNHILRMLLEDEHRDVEFTGKSLENERFSATNGTTDAHTGDRIGTG